MSKVEIPKFKELRFPKGEISDQPLSRYTWELKRLTLTFKLLRPCGVMAAHQTSDLGVAGSSPVKVGFLSITKFKS